MTEFLVAVRGNLSANRKALVDKAFSILSGGAPVVRQSHLEAKYRGGDVRLLMRSLGDRNGDGMITPAEFNDYCTLPRGFTTTAVVALLVCQIIRVCVVAWVSSRRFHLGASSPLPSADAAISANFDTDAEFGFMMRNA